MATPQSDLAKVQKLLTLILAELDRVCQLIGVSYAIYGGTAIGAIRHGGFIPWDDDIDVMMTRTDYERFLVQAPQHMDERFRLDNTRTRDDFPFMFTKMVIPGTLLVPEAARDSTYRMPFFLDILPLDEIPSDEEAFRAMSRASWWWGRLLFLQGTARPYLINPPAWKKALIYSATTVAHLGLKALRATPRSLQARWERAVRRYEGAGTGVYADFTMRDPQHWIVREEEFSPPAGFPSRILP